MANQLKKESNLCSQDNVCNLTNRGSKRKIIQISEQNIVNKKAKICEENASDLIQCNELQDKTCKFDNVDVLAENIPILVDNSNVLENNCTNTQKNNKQETLKSKSTVLINFHQCEFCPRSFRSAQTLTVHCNFQHKDKLEKDEALVSSDVNECSNVIVNSKKTFTRRSTAHTNLSEPTKQVISVENGTEILSSNLQSTEFNLHCNNDKLCTNNVKVNSKKSDQVATTSINVKIQTKSSYKKNVNKEVLPTNNFKCAENNGKIIANQQKKSNTVIKNLSCRKFCTVIQNRYFCSACCLMFLNKKVASTHTSTEHSEVRNTTKIITKIKHISNCKRIGKQCIVHKSLYLKKSILYKKCNRKNEVMVQRFYCSLCKLHFSKHDVCVKHIKQVHDVNDAKVAKKINSKLTTFYKCYKCHGLFKFRFKLKYHVSFCDGSSKLLQSKTLGKELARIPSYKKTEIQETKPEGVKKQVNYLTETSSVEIGQSSEPDVTVPGTQNNRTIPVVSELQDSLQQDAVPPGQQANAAYNGLIPENNPNSSSLHLYQNTANPPIQNKQYGMQEQSKNLDVQHTIGSSTTVNTNLMNFTSTTGLCFTNSENLSETCNNDNVEHFVNALASTVNLNVFEIILDATYFCPICNLGHKNKAELLEHIYVHHPQLFNPTAQISVTKTVIFSCRLCPSKQYSVGDCAQHVESYHLLQANALLVSEVHVDRFHCTKCELHFAMRHHCIRHMYTCHGIKVSEQYNINSKLTTMHKCHNCLKIYQSMAALDNHTCHFLTTKKDALYSSIDVLHHFCPLCEQHFPGIKSCQRHISLTHPNGTDLKDEFMRIVSKMCVIWICHICSSLRTKHFDYKQALAEHMILHNVTVHLTDEEMSEVANIIPAVKQNIHSKLPQKKPAAKSKTYSKKGKKKQKKNYSENDTTDESQDSEHILGLNPDENTYDSQHSKSSLIDSDDNKDEHSTDNFVCTKQTEFLCPFCSSVFESEYAALLHTQQDHVDLLYDKLEILSQIQQTFTCKTCDTIVYSPEECTQHDSECTPSYDENRIVAVKIKRIHCPSCTQHFAMRHHCIRHMAKVHNIKAKMHVQLQSKLTTMYKCPKCMKLYHSVASLRSHISRCTIAFHKHKTTYSKVEDELYFCPICSQYFTSMYLCRRHMNLVHTDEKVSSKKIVSKVCAVWICHICSSLRKKYFDSKASLNEHMSKHKIKSNEKEKESFAECKNIINMSDENTSNEEFSLEEHKRTYFTDYSKLTSDKSEKYEPPTYITANNYITPTNGTDVTQSQYIENVSMDFYSTNLTNVSNNDFTQNLSVHQNSAVHPPQEQVVNSGQENKETNTESLLYGFQILNSMSTTTDSDFHFDKQMNQSHISGNDLGMSKCLTPIQNISPVYVPQPLHYSSIPYSQPYSNNFDYISNAQYPSLGYSSANLSLDVISNIPQTVVSNDHNFYLYTQDYANTSSVTSIRDDVAILQNVKTEIPQIAPANNENLYPVDNYSNVPQYVNILPQYSNIPQYTETNVPTQEHNFQKFNTNNPNAQCIDESLLQENECSIQVVRSHCPQCNLHFSKQHDCVYHIRNTHTSDLQTLNNIVTMPTTMYKCHNCNKLCVTLMALQSHVLKCKTTKNKDSYSCSNESRYFCPYCQQHFQNLFLCERHINLIHKDMSAFNHNIENKLHDLWICHICSALRTKYFDTKSLLADHMISKHSITIDDIQEDGNSRSFGLIETVDMPTICSTDSMQNIDENSFLQLQESSHCADFQNASSQQFQIKEEFITSDQVVQQTILPQFPTSESTLFQLANTEPIYQPQKIQQDPLCQASSIPNYSTETFSVHSDNTQLSFANSESHETESNTEFTMKQEDISTQMSSRNEQSLSEDYDSSVTPSIEIKTGKNNSDSLWTIEVLRTHCNICMLHFSNPQNCMNHIKASHKYVVSHSEHIHTKLTTMYKCDKCAKMCVNKAAVKHHISTCKNVKSREDDVYSKVQLIRYFCPECQQHFSSVAMCRRHVNINHENAENVFLGITKKTCDLWVCQICSTLKTKYFDTKLLLANHMTRHNVVIDTDSEDVIPLNDTSINSTFQTQDSNTNSSLTNDRKHSQEVSQNLPQINEFQNIKNEEHYENVSTDFANINYQPPNVVNNPQTFFSEAFNIINDHNQEPVYTNCTTEVNDNVADTNYIQSEYQVANPDSENINNIKYVSAEHLENNNPVLGDFISCLQSEYSCLLCDKHYKTELNVSEHLKTEHQIDYLQSTHISKTDTESYLCKVCKLSMNSISQCIEHKSMCQKNKEEGENEFVVQVKRFYCPVCFAHHSQRQHTYRHLMNVHKSNHDAVKNILHLQTLMYKCNNCSKLQTSMSLLNKHKSTCKKSQIEGRYSKVTKSLYYCPACEQHFSCPNYCKKHIKQFHKDDGDMNPVHKLRHVWICNVCSSLRTRLFDTKSLLANHMLSHNIVAPESDSDDSIQDSASEVVEVCDEGQEIKDKIKHKSAANLNDDSNSSVKETKTNKDKKVVPEAYRRMTRSSTNSNSN